MSRMNERPNNDAPKFKEKATVSVIQNENAIKFKNNKDNLFK